MRSLTSKLVKKETRRSLLAALFLIVFLAEAGSHGLICSSQRSTNELSVSSTGGGHDDPCKTLIVCSDSKRKDQQLPTFSHDSMQHNAMFDRGSDLQNQFDMRSEARIPFGAAHTLFRPPSPPFHPPEIS